MQNMKTYLVISALGSDRSGIVDALSKIIADQDCNIEDSRMSVLGGEFAVMLLVSGNWNTIAKLESHLPTLEQKLGMTIVCKNTERRKQSSNAVPYVADVISMDHPGIVNKLANFFSTRNINIEELSTSNYAAAHTGTPMFSVHIEIGVPSDITIAELRESFMDFCDNLNLDAVLEPLKA
ncbi:MAG: glycine cleavage system protein R [Gammaproteobacteria bacterium]|nr:glycine cleavage system protein R [Gammaproteobacteria bacterium]